MRRRRLGLPAVRHAVVLVVDGLGARNLAARAGHARMLAPLARQDDDHRRRVPDDDGVRADDPDDGHAARAARHRRVPRARPAQRRGRQPADAAGTTARPRDLAAVPHACSSAPAIGTCASFAIGPPQVRRLGLHAARCCAGPSTSSARTIARAGRRRRALAATVPARRSSTSTSPSSTRSRTRAAGSRDEWAAALEQLDARSRALARASRPRAGRARHGRPRHGRRAARPARALRHGARARRRRRGTSAASRAACSCTSSRARRRRRRARWPSAGARSRATGPGCDPRRGDRRRAVRAGRDPRCCRGSATCSSPRASASRTTTRATRQRSGQQMVGQHGSLTPEERACR